MDDLSPVSTLRLNFDQLPAETTDPIPEKSVFGVPVAQFVPQSVFSWLDGANGAQNNLDCPSTMSSRRNEMHVMHGSNEPSCVITRKVCSFCRSI